MTERHGAGHRSPGTHALAARAVPLSENSPLIVRAVLSKPFQSEESAQSDRGGGTLARSDKKSASSGRQKICLCRPSFSTPREHEHADNFPPLQHSGLDREATYRRSKETYRRLRGFVPFRSRTASHIQRRQSGDLGGALELVRRFGVGTSCRKSCCLRQFVPTASCWKSWKTSSPMRN